jgi:hypothetical protein
METDHDVFPVGRGPAEGALVGIRAGRDRQEDPNQPPKAAREEANQEMKDVHGFFAAVEGLFLAGLAVGWRFGHRSISASSVQRDHFAQSRAEL